MAGATASAAKRRSAAPTERRAARQHLRERPGVVGRRSGAKERVEKTSERQRRETREERREPRAGNGRNERTSVKGRVR